MTRGLVVNGWAIYAHPLFLQQLDELKAEVELLKKEDPHGYSQKNKAKRLAATTQLAFNDIPQDPTRAEYRQGDTLGDEYKHWFRAKFYQQYRLFFRYREDAKLIVFAWRLPYGSKTDAYKVFRKMLNDGRPPDDWDALFKEAQVISEQGHPDSL